MPGLSESLVPWSSTSGEAEDIHGAIDVIARNFQRLTRVMSFKTCKQVSAFFHDIRDSKHGLGTLFRRHTSHCRNAS